MTFSDTRNPIWIYFFLPLIINIVFYITIKIHLVYFVILSLNMEHTLLFMKIQNIIHLIK